MQNSLKDKKVLVWGLGVSGGGVGVVRFLAQQGADITVLDQKSKKELAESLEKIKKTKAKLVLGKKKPAVKLLDDVELLVVNPGIDLRDPFIKAAEKREIPIHTEISLFLERVKGEVIAITGSKGKSTVSQLIYTILERARKNVVLGGNMGVSLLEELDKITARTYVVLEISSFQLDLIQRSGIEFRPPVAVITNIMPDHLDRYDSFKDYKASKLSILDGLKGNNHAVVHRDLKQHVYRKKMYIRYFTDELPSYLNDVDIQLLGSHNRENIAAAAEVADILKVKERVVVDAVRSFSGLEHRMEFVRYVSGIKFYNDSASTTPTSTAAAIRSFPRSVILIAGGVNKELPLKPLLQAVKDNVKEVYLFGKDANVLHKAIAKKVGKKVKVVKVKTMEDALEKAYGAATFRDVVLFSPACTSFDQFVNAKERGLQFKERVDNLVEV